MSAEQEKQLARIESKVDALCELTVEVRHLRMQVDRHHAAIYGTVDESSPGLDKRVDRLEQWQRSRRRWLAAVWGGITTAVGSAIYAIFERRQ